MDPISKTTMLGAAGVGGESYWYSTIDDASSNFYTGLDVDGDGNIYGSISSSLQQFMVIKYDSDGAIQWQKSLQSNSIDAHGVVYNSNLNRVYVSGRGYTGSSYDIILAAYNASTGSKDYVVQTGGSGNDYGQSIANYGNNIYIAGHQNSQTFGTSDGFITNLTSNAGVNWARAFGATNADLFYNMAVGTTGNLYTTGYTTSQGAGSQNGLVVKFDNGGTPLHWQRVLGSSSFQYTIFFDITVDALESPIAVGRAYNNSTSTFEMIIAKYDSNGNLQWNRTLAAGGGNNTYGHAVTTDSSRNVYAYGHSAIGGYNVLVLFKLDPSGTIIFQRAFGRSSTGPNANYYLSGDSSNPLVLDGLGNMYFGGYRDTDGAGVLVKLPDDGSLVGTYGDVEYSAISFTLSTPSMTSTTSTLSDTSWSLPGGSIHSATDSTPSHTVVTTNL